MRTYKATVRKVHEARTALYTAGLSARSSSRELISDVLAPMQSAINSLRVQVCQDCNEAGYYVKPGDPYASHGCHHPNVPFYDVETGEVRDHR